MLSTVQKLNKKKEFDIYVNKANQFKQSLDDLLYNHKNSKESRAELNKLEKDY